MILRMDELSGILPSCCTMRAVGIGKFLPAEKSRMLEMLPGTRTVLVIGHHIRESLEWVWFPSDSEKNGSTCAADLHTKSVAEKMSCILKSHGYSQYIVPYPGRSGLLFKNVATQAGLGQRGDNFLLLHPEWGPWIHLRVVLTSATVAPAPQVSGERGICTHCGQCRTSCPGKAIGDGTFDAELCDRTQAERAGTSGLPGYPFKCEICLRSCPVGRQPPNLHIAIQ